MKEVIKKRIINVEGMTCEGCEKSINDAVSGLKGVINVSADKSGIVEVEYDLMKVNLEQIEKKITGLKFTLPAGLLDRFRRGLINYKEQNEYDNMHIIPKLCCSDPRDNNFNCNC